MAAFECDDGVGVVVENCVNNWDMILVNGCRSLKSPASIPVPSLEIVGKKKKKSTVQCTMEKIVSLDGMEYKGKLTIVFHFPEYRHTRVCLSQLALHERNDDVDFQGPEGWLPSAYPVRGLLDTAFLCDTKLATCLNPELHMI